MGISAETQEDAVTLRTLEQETRRIEKEAKADLKKAQIEKSKEAFFEYDAKMAQQTEARLEANEKAAELEFENDKDEVNTLSLMELKAEREVLLATTKEEKAAKQKEVKVRTSLTVRHLLRVESHYLAHDMHHSPKAALGEGKGHRTKRK